VVLDPPAFDPRLPPNFDLSAAKRVKKILNQRNNPSEKKKVSVEQEVAEHPHGLLPIHLRSQPLPQLPPNDVLFAQRNGANNIVKRRRKDLANHVQEFREQPVRTQSVFIDNSAIERRRRHRIQSNYSCQFQTYFSGSTNSYAIY